jgi:hypothetical protein
MKLPLLRIRANSTLAFALAAGAFLVSQDPAPAATLTVTPAAVGNTYTGVLTLNVTGLTNGEPVIIRRYLDANVNGTLDSGELLLDAFRISESGVSTIGGITNLNVPFDHNSATDAITTTLSFAPPLENLVGQHLFQLVSPSGRFSPQTAIFNVTNAPLAQSISGTVFSGATPLPQAIVVALQLPNNVYVSAVVADANGHYQLKLNPADYTLLAALPNYFADASQSPMVTLSSGLAATNDLFLTNGTVTISGQVYDAGNSNGVGGAFLQLESGNLFGVAFSATNGNYSAALAAASDWKVRIESSRLGRRAYVASGDGLHVDTTSGNVTGANIGLPKANALFYGRLADGSNAPLANVDCFAGATSQPFKADGFSDANGNYAVAVLADGGQWNCTPDPGNNVVLANYIVGGSLGSVAISPGQALLQNFSTLLATARISGRLQDNLGNSVSGVGISANAEINGTQYNTFLDTDGSGNYSLPAAAGTWSVYVNCCGSDGLENFGLVDFGPHIASIPPTNAVLNLTVYPIGTPWLSQPGRFGPSTFGFNLSGAQGSNYTIQASTNLSSTNWATITIISNLPGNSFFIQDNQATNRQRFYRALLKP